MGYQILEKFFSKISRVDGSDNVPPTYCLRSVYIPAYVAVYVKATGSPKPSRTDFGLLLAQVG
jgi:hypothetical protein